MNLKLLRQYQQDAANKYQKEYKTYSGNVEKYNWMGAHDPSSFVWDTGGRFNYIKDFAQNPDTINNLQEQIKVAERRGDTEKAASLQSDLDAELKKPTENTYGSFGYYGGYSNDPKLYFSQGEEATQIGSDKGRNIAIQDPHWRPDMDKINSLKDQIQTLKDTPADEVPYMDSGNPFAPALSKDQQISQLQKQIDQASTPPLIQYDPFTKANPSKLTAPGENQAHYYLDGQLVDQKDYDKLLGKFLISADPISKVTSSHQEQYDTGLTTGGDPESGTPGTPLMQTKDVADTWEAGGPTWSIEDQYKQWKEGTATQDLNILQGPGSGYINFYLSSDPGGMAKPINPTYQDPGFTVKQQKALDTGVMPMSQGEAELAQAQGHVVTPAVDTTSGRYTQSAFAKLSPYDTSTSGVLNQALKADEQARQQGSAATLLRASPTINIGGK